MNEVWKPVPSAPWLEASSLGRIRQVPFLAKLPSGGERTYGGKPRIGTWDGERYVTYIRRKNYKIARLVCEAFHGPPPDGRPLCLHGDENSRNNRPENLSWGTPRENMNAPGFLKTARNRAWLRGRDVGLKLTRQSAREIRVATGSNAEVARKFGVSATLVSQIRNNLVWKDC